MGVGVGVLVPPLLAPELPPEAVVPDEVVFLVLPEDEVFDVAPPLVVFEEGDGADESPAAFHCSFAAFGLLLDATVVPWLVCRSGSLLPCFFAKPNPIPTISKNPSIVEPSAVATKVLSVK